MLRYIDINFHVAHDNELAPVIDRYKTSYEYLKYLPAHMDVQVVTHFKGAAASVRHEGILYSGFRRKNSFFGLPWAAAQYLKQQKPDVVLIQGLVFPLQTLMLRLFVGNNCRFIAQHHGGIPFESRMPRKLQQLADKCIDRYLFTSVGNAVQWVEHAIISAMEKCLEVPEASTFLTQQPKEESLRITGMCGECNFLWVGRLIPGKDPFTILKAFEKYLSLFHDSHLYMIYQDDELLKEVTELVSSSTTLQNHVHLVGKVPHNQLPYWYSAADYYVSGSHREGSGYALIECMACGCIPIVSDIPPFMALTHNGKAGFHFKRGDVEDCFEVLCSLNGIDKQAFSEKILVHFQDHLSFESIADKIAVVIKQLEVR